MMIGNSLRNLFEETYVNLSYIFSPLKIGCMHLAAYFDIAYMTCHPVHYAVGRNGTDRKFPVRHIERSQNSIVLKITKQSYYEFRKTLISDKIISKGS